MSNLLLDEQPLIVMPKLACKIGLNEAIVLQQIHYWLEINKKTKNNFKDGRYWTFNTYRKWQEQFPFWHINTIQTTIKNLEMLKLITIGNYNKLKMDKTKWYTIDYKALEALEQSRLHKICVTNIQEWYDELTKIVSPLPETTTETNTETSVYIDKVDDIDFLCIYNDCYNKYMKRKHPKITNQQLKYIRKSCETLKLYYIDEDIFAGAVEEHLKNLPDKNNGNILAFLKASNRYFNIWLDAI